MSDLTPERTEELLAAIAESRNDEAFTARLREAIERDKPTLDRLADLESDGIVWLRSKENGRLERERFGRTPFADVPPSPYYTPKPGWWMSTRAWLDADGLHVVAAHDCTDGREVCILPWPTWQATDEGVTPSLDCDGCGVHCHLSIDYELASAS